MPEQFNLYLIINVIAIAGPFLLSFDKKVAFYKKWPKLLVALSFLWAIYIPWDIFFAFSLEWGFNSDYLVGFEFLHLPLEEWMFFIIIPYCYLFIYECVKSYFPKTKEKTILPYYFFIGVALSQVYYGGIYSYINLLVVLLAFMLVRSKLNMAFWWSYLLTLLPFLIFNGILTGSITEDPIVWYNSAAFSDVRIGTIPSEDFIYLLGMMLLCFKGWTWKED
ncbi:lycopene cyclase domain-containing protein [Flammeovirga agarivorans]|uniref:Lycopene cyclase domain-containing protein n=1 Tax=Flammeovirga agarivorans TaxID=2726742 RepID=A0A7X8XUQ9_9BACT|nr:lycopene cyclase domain-containing protein [Flammeovirga agarivorans]NLR90571.1 lycopene cyclase domain-containing protein [Flammeovirga agarivorans]